MIWTPDQLSKLDIARRAATVLAIRVQQIIESIPADTYGRDSLIQANEHLSGAEENIAEVLDHAKAAHEYTEALGALAAWSGGQ